MSVPRDRDGSFEPIVVPKHQYKANIGRYYQKWG
ncbi:hypothetical protein [Flavobacterium sp. I3-2]